MSSTPSVDEQLAELRAKLDALAVENEKVAAEREQYRKLYLQTLELCKKLARHPRAQAREAVTE